MRVYRIKRTQILHTTVEDAWKFFSNPDNLVLITPGYMNFRIVHRSGEENIYGGQMIHYKVCILPGLPVDWLSEITHVREPYYFVDEQRNGPYKLWQHQHRLREVKGGVELTDEVNYAIPFGIIGRLAKVLFVEKSLNAIFDYRFKVLEELFNDNQNTTFGRKNNP